MKLQTTALSLLVLFSLLLGGISSAATVTCTVETIADGKVILSCGEAADKLKPGLEVKVKTATTRKKLEGC